MTLTTLVRLQLLAELALDIVVAAWLHRAWGWSVPAAAGTVVAIGLAVRLAIVCFSTTVSWFARTPRAPEQQLSPWGTVRLVLDEWRAMLADNFWFLPFEAIAMRADPPLAPTGAVPVLLVHGYLSNRGILHAVARALERAGIAPVYSFNFQGVFQPIADYVAELDERIRKVLEATGQPQLVLVCHSMGGLIARAWIAKHGAGRIRKLVTIASPHNGTHHARLGLGANAKDMCRGSDFCAELARSEGEAGPGCPATSIYSAHDNLVTPQETSRLPWAKNVALHGVAHVEILNVERMHRALVEELRGTGVRLAT